ncbi:MAG: TatD family hydrolase [Lachnospiraceae bacterium]|nr:TatD family hydrolase [Lachnospiraceae bacterium]
MIDTHAHYDDSAFDGDREAVFAAAKAAGVTHIINAASDAASLAKIDALLKQYEILRTAVGLHPENAADLTGDALEAHLDAVRRFARYGSLAADASSTADTSSTAGASSEKDPAHPQENLPGKVVAIGEIGLDYHYDTPAPDAAGEVRERAAQWDHGSDPVNWPPRSVQKELFRRQIAMAKELRLPVVVHSRDAAEDTLAIIRETGAGESGCDMHCFGYSKEMAREFLNAGCFLGIGGVSTFKNGKKLKEVIAYAPLDRLLLETDAPYLAPEPFRGKRNESAYLTRVVRAIAEIKGIDEEKVIAQTTKNALRLFDML